MIVFPANIAREIGRLAWETRLPLLFLLRDARHGIVTRDNLRQRDQIVAAITYDHSAARPRWGVVSAELSARLIAAAVASEAACPDPDPFADLDRTGNDFAHVYDMPSFLCARCASWSNVIGSTWSDAPPENVSAGPCWALCVSCHETLKATNDPNIRPMF